MLEGTVIPDLVLRSGVTSVIGQEFSKLGVTLNQILAEDLAEEIIETRR